jgi:tRNA A-37 threonylcarbamoyl transferase component Bud32
MSLHVGEAIGDYRVIGIIGAGGMGQVFQVEHKITKRKEAMKVLIADLADETQVQRFKREIEVQARLNHPNIAAVHNAFRLKDRMVLVLEFVEGQTLENLLKHGRPQLETGIDYVRQTLAALDYAHHNGVIHRDVSPANLMITEQGLVKLMDFGVAKSLGDLRLTDGGSMIGSLYYMSPEQVKGATDPDPRSDIYSAGAILYEIVTGKKPFDYEDRFSLMVAQVEEQPRLPSLIDPELPAEMDDIILRALAKDPGRRYSSAKDFLTALEIFQQPAAISTVKPAARPKRRAISEAVAGVAVLLICGLAGVGAVAWNRLSEPLLAPPAVVSAVPKAPENLAAIPPDLAAATAPSPMEQPAAVQATSVQPASAPVTKPVVKQLATAGKARTAPAPRETKPVETKPAEEPAGAEVQSSAPLQAEVPVPPAQHRPEALPTEPKKTSFWGKLNPFRGKASKKKKDDSALRSPADAATESRQ